MPTFSSSLAFCTVGRATDRSQRCRTGPKLGKQSGSGAGLLCDLRYTGNLYDASGFVSEVRAQSGKKISLQLDAKLIANAQVIEAEIGCKLS